jgi:hypothetical protein
MSSCEAKDLIAACNRHEILRFAQDDSRSYRLMNSAATTRKAISADCWTAPKVSPV